MKYRVIIADDERKIIQLIRQLGHWEQYDIEVVAECQDGQHALECILEYRPDFVLSDIKMPIIDGIELINKIREQGLDTIFILLSGYRHFEYARSAIQLNVMDYLLKPIDEEQLNQTLEKVCKRIDAIKEQGELHSRLSHLETQEEKKELAEFFKALINRNNNIETFSGMTKEQCNTVHHTNFDKECYQIICVMSKMNGMLNQNDSTFSGKVNDYIHSCFAEIATVYSYATLQGIIIVLNYDKDRQSDIKKAVSALYYSIKDLREIYGDFRLNMGCSDIKYFIKELVHAFEEAASAEWGRLIFFGNSIIEYKQIAGQAIFTMSDLMSSEEKKQLLDSVKFLRDEELSVVMEKVYKRAAHFNNANPGSMNKVFYELYEDLLTSISDQAEQERFIESYYYTYMEGKNFQQVIKNIYICLNQYIVDEQAKLKEKLGKPLSEAVKFMRANYMNQISQEDAAKVGNVSTTYLSRLFKEEMHIGFNEYLTQIRLEKSQELLVETNKSIKEIAVLVGYMDEKYYSKLFKKSIGIKPTEYRKLYG